MTSILDLPSEIYWPIARYAAALPVIAGSNALKSLALTCRSFRELAQAVLFSTASTVNINSLDHAKALLTNERILELIKSAEKLKLSVAFHRDDVLRATHFQEQCDVLASTGRFFSQIKALYLNLSTLPLDDHEDLNLDGLDKALGDLVFLQVTHLEFHLNKRDESIDLVLPFLSRVPCLSGLTLSGQGGLRNNLHVNQHIALPSLGRLETSALKDENGSSLITLASHLERGTLWQVEVAFVRAFSTCFDEFGIELLPGLQSLTIDNQTVIFENERLESLEHLEESVAHVHDETNLFFLTLTANGLTTTFSRAVRMAPRKVKFLSFSGAPSAVWDVDDEEEIENLVRGRHFVHIQVSYVPEDRQEHDHAEVFRRQELVAQVLASFNMQLVITPIITQADNPDQEQDSGEETGLNTLSIEEETV